MRRTIPQCQQALIKAGFPCGPAGADGKLGDATKRAILAFQRSVNLPRTGRLDSDTLARLFATENGAISMADSVNVPVKSAWLSKINWTIALTLIFNVFMLLGHPVPPDVQAAVQTGGTALGLVITWAIRTFFTTAVTTASANKL